MQDRYVKSTFKNNKQQQQLFFLAKQIDPEIAERGGKNSTGLVSNITSIIVIKKTKTSIYSKMQNEYFHQTKYDFSVILRRSLKRGLTFNYYSFFLHSSICFGDKLKSAGKNMT